MRIITDKMAIWPVRVVTKVQLLTFLFANSLLYSQIVFTVFQFIKFWFINYTLEKATWQLFFRHDCLIQSLTAYSCRCSPLPAPPKTPSVRVIGIPLSFKVRFACTREFYNADVTEKRYYLCFTFRFFAVEFCCLLVFVNKKNQYSIFSS